MALAAHPSGACVISASPHWGTPRFVHNRYGLIAAPMVSDLQYNLLSERTVFTSNVFLRRADQQVLRKLLSLLSCVPLGVVTLSNYSFSAENIMIISADTRVRCLA